MPPAPLYLRTLWRYANAVIIIIIIIMTVTGRGAKVFGSRSVQSPTQRNDNQIIYRKVREFKSHRVDDVH